jgi:ABC-type xylose transport system permease subunit
MEPFVSLFGPIDTLLAPFIEYILLALLVVNMVFRGLEYRQQREEAEDGADNITRSAGRVGTNFLLVVGSFYYLTVHHHGGMVFAVLFLGVFITDLFEFESRKVEARRGIPIERPKGAIAASFLALLYIAYQALFFVIAPVWNSIV